MYVKKLRTYTLYKKHVLTYFLHFIQKQNTNHVGMYVNKI